jgi:hypothetical protein
VIDVRGSAGQLAGVVQSWLGTERSVRGAGWGVGGWGVGRAALARLTPSNQLLTCSRKVRLLEPKWARTLGPIGADKGGYGPIGNDKGR